MLRYFFGFPKKAFRVFLLVCFGSSMGHVDTWVSQGQWQADQWGPSGCSLAAVPLRSACARRGAALSFCSPPDRKGLLDLMLASAFARRLHHAPTQYPARAARQWIPLSIPPELLASGSRRDSAEYPARAARQWIPPSIPPEQPASGSRRVSSSSGDPAEHPGEYPLPVDHAEYPASIEPEPAFASGARQSGFA